MFAPLTHEVEKVAPAIPTLGIEFAADEELAFAQQFTTYFFVERTCRVLREDAHDRGMQTPPHCQACPFAHETPPYARLLNRLEQVDGMKLGIELGEWFSDQAAGDESNDALVGVDRDEDVRSSLVGD